MFLYGGSSCSNRELIFDIENSATLKDNGWLKCSFNGSAQLKDVNIYVCSHCYQHRCNLCILRANRQFVLDPRRVPESVPWHTSPSKNSGECGFPDRHIGGEVWSSIEMVKTHFFVLNYVKRYCQLLSSKYIEQSVSKVSKKCYFCRYRLESTAQPPCYTLQPPVTHIPDLKVT